MPKDKVKVLLLALFLSVPLFFFLPFCDFLYLKLLNPFFSDSPFIRLSFFPLLSFLLYFSIHPKWDWAFPHLKFVFLSTPLPVFISYVFGQWSKMPENQQDFVTYYWYVFCIPLGEEFLFRGWAFEIFERLYSKTNFSAWMTSLMFSLWHLQNLSKSPVTLVLFQVLYTFFTGLWLAEIRIRCRNPFASTVAHSLLNLAASLP